MRKDSALDETISHFRFICFVCTVGIVDADPVLFVAVADESRPNVDGAGSSFACAWPCTEPDVAVGSTDEREGLDVMLVTEQEASCLGSGLPAFY